MNIIFNGTITITTRINYVSAEHIIFRITIYLF
jgi:hypothetical protein